MAQRSSNFEVRLSFVGSSSDPMTLLNRLGSPTGYSFYELKQAYLDLPYGFVELPLSLLRFTSRVYHKLLLGSLKIPHEVHRATIKLA
ncbi:hypothetical protein Csa_020760 [Cucumis sativus]|uniref:Uncharacterized protein n=1 Tax=Cucumis sativus TaxID=3659 RepID=A0A0A0KGA9_CUCSA|nr:hypothetical protein Csa_020760 [Cucumis sativus]